ncbi:E3 ubiquitin-protein ligase TRIM21 [Nothobranchius furzeri]|uniref:E3 ubiquitin-protein ligase TRIM39-like n=1 Tax=Nothobranchius furzeri TaxID=105023 RepID=A0A8C6L6V8_NOTFU|nr:E3 ubiquitin-protein ligase TRIM39 [Nothobranchius furzeri]KAF7215682.1 E3 ubiquitin-protein ligase TRIM39-like [Nothobranchius furzeri]
MATAASILSKEQLLCPICLDVFNQPVSTPCGHNFCRDCIQRYWNGTSMPQCPMCKHTLYKRPDLKVNTFISEVASHFKKLGEKCKDRTKATDLSVALKGDICCDVCTGRTVKALKSCLDCLASFCETHLEPHHVLVTLKHHRLISPMICMQDRVCKKHESLLDLFCHTDQTYVCQHCVSDKHKTHHTVCIEDESRDRRAQIRNLNVEIREMIHGRLEKIREINQAVQLSRRNTENEVEESLRVFNKLLQFVQKGQAEVDEVIREKQRRVEIMASGLIKELEQEIDDLKCRNTELDLLLFTNDDLYLLKSFPAFCTMPAVKDWSEAWAQSSKYVGTVRRSVRRVASLIEEAVKTEVKRLCEVEFTRVKSCVVEVSLDPDTAHPKLVLSENKKQVYHGDVAQSLPDNPERFYPCVSVLAREGFSSGRFYYEVQVKGKTEWDIGVALESVNRKGGNLLNPERGYWTLGMRKDEKYWALSSPPVCVPLVEKPQTVGVYVDLEGGQVSFYNVHAQSHIYTFTGYTFRDRLFPYFNPRRNHDGVNSSPLVISPVNV